MVVMVVDSVMAVAVGMAAVACCPTVVVMNVLVISVAVATVVEVVFPQSQWSWVMMAVALAAVVEVVSPRSQWSTVVSGGVRKSCFPTATMVVVVGDGSSRGGGRKRCFPTVTVVVGGDVSSRG